MILTLIAPILLSLVHAGSPANLRDHILFDANWRFWRGADGQAAPGLEPLQRSFDDSKWRTVHLPHDYVVEGSFDPHGDVSHGTLPHP